MTIEHAPKTRIFRGKRYYKQGTGYDKKDALKEAGYFRTYHGGLAHIVETRNHGWAVYFKPVK